MVKNANLKHDILKALFSNHECISTSNLKPFLINAVRRIYYLALFCNDIDKLEVMFDTQNKIIEDYCNRY